MGKILRTYLVKVEEDFHKAESKVGHAMAVNELMIQIAKLTWMLEDIYRRAQGELFDAGTGL